ncbi:hypothetical protein CTN00_01635 [Fusobacterium pseudoperiodonticum]|uniref:hypothetical protein n=1 Tax=Fusobacterium pseudoperiodonticum TaxID=2663009 RepID=UPI000C1C7F48|nr:hypothetical protein [Fusobacterium pseudoperiodonticum]ATV71787.1 hypothetical protein CTN00_01635 [Fusobacterium pseudoperiodonticum]
MEKEKVLEIEIKKINDKYSVFYPTKLNIKELEKIGYTVTEFDLLDEIEKSAINFYFNNKNDFTILLNDTSLNVPFIIENIYIRELERIVDGYNEKYGIPYRWRAKENEEYYFLDGKCEIWKTIEEKKNADNTFFEQGNYFKTKGEAEKVKAELDKFWEKVRAGEIGK